MVINRIRALVATAVLLLTAAVLASCEDQSGGYPTPQLRGVQR